MPDRKTRQANRSYRRAARKSSRMSCRMERGGRCQRASAVGNAMPGSRYREKHIRNKTRQMKGLPEMGKEIRQTVTGLGTLVGGAMLVRKHLFNNGN